MVSIPNLKLCFMVFFYEFKHRFQYGFKQLAKQ